eukprot:scaffold4458_cov21-Tisochrysis_lutea.AAC.1
MTYSKLPASLFKAVRPNGAITISPARLHPKGKGAAKTCPDLLATLFKDFRTALPKHTQICQLICSMIFIHMLPLPSLMRACTPQGIAKTYPKLPASLFKDFRPDGAIAIIAARLHQFKKTRGIRQIDWNSPAMRRQPYHAQVGKEREGRSWCAPRAFVIVALKCICSCTSVISRERPTSEQLRSCGFNCGMLSGQDAEFIRQVLLAGCTSKIHDLVAVCWMACEGF